MTTLLRSTCIARCLALAVATVSLPSCADMPAAQINSPQSRDSFEAAFRNKSTSPSFVMITLTGNGKESARTLCVNANLLIGAIMRETGVGQPQAEQLALSNQAHTFRFATQAALDNLPRRYSDVDLANARAVLAPFSASELQHEFSSLYERPRLPPTQIPRAALACALIERGLSPKMADRSGQVYVEPLRAYR